MGDVRDAKAAARAKAYRDRKRRHGQGDHTRCVLGRCVAVTPESHLLPVAPVKPKPAEPGPVMPEEPVAAAGGPSEVPGLGERGQRLWDDVTAAWPPTALHREMLLEACRMADRLERLDRHLKGEDWLRFWARNEDGTRVEVIVDKLLTEARELQGAFRMAVTDLVKAMPAKKPNVKGGGKLASVTALLDAKRPSAG